MSRLPPSLLYLTIYNPTLQPSAPVEEDHEDAEEQAHILFYTSKERAVSRDRMLRQIGLAKALVNFAELFSADDTCNNVHSQSKRMVMVSPEPNFWIHAGIEVAKVPKVPDPKAKKGKSADKVPQYDYDDGSLHDIALRAHILKGYERFKLTHGSFTSILSSLGQQALELQLERFWTVWSWSWDMEESPDFGEDFGPHLHPHFSALIPLIDEYAAGLSANTTPLLLSRPHIIPSTKFSTGRYSPSLARHLSGMIPERLQPSQSSDTLNASVDTIRGPMPKASGNTFLNMDMRKWNWTGAFTFGKGSSSDGKPSAQNVINPTEPAPETAHVEAEVDADDLQDAISSDSISSHSREQDHEEALQTKELGGSLTDGRLVPSDTAEAESPAELIEFAVPPAEESESPPPTPPPPPEFSMTRVHLAPVRDPTNTQRVSVHYLIRRDFMLALLNAQEQTDESEGLENADIHYASENALKLFDDIESIVYDAGLKSVSEPLPSANKILQSQDRYLISTRQYTLGSPGFASQSSHLFNAKAILETDREISEVFSRGQNPQHWHIARRGLGGTNPALGITGADEDVFMEVFRKETSLTDVDNVLVGVLRKSGLVDSSSPAASR